MLTNSVSRFTFFQIPAYHSINCVTLNVQVKNTFAVGITAYVHLVRELDRSSCFNNNRIKTSIRENKKKQRPYNIDIFPAADNKEECH